MKRKIFYILILSILIILIILTIVLINIPKNTQAIINGKTINMELAKTSAEQQKGLMFRESLDENSGMLFIFSDDRIRSFWMKNTLIPLDIIFIDSNNKIIDIQNAEPCVKEPCRDYISKFPARYVLELNSGESGNISISDKVEFKNL